MMLYKFTDPKGQTKNETQWGEGIEHTTPGGDGLPRTDFWLCAYRDPILGVMMDPVHGKFLDSPGARLWECEGDVGLDDGTKVGCTKLTTVKEIPIPEVTLEQKITFGILCAKGVFKDSKWNEWADRWLSGEDQSAEAARAAAWTVWAVEGAAKAAAAGAAWAWWAAEGAAKAAEAAAETKVDLVALAHKAVAKEYGVSG